MWVSTLLSIPTHGMNGKTFKLKLKFHDWYGHNIDNIGDTVEAVWDSTCEWFYEKETMKLIADDDIIAWWKEDS